MTYQVTLTNGQNFRINTDLEDFDTKITIQLDDTSTRWINLGGCVVQKIFVGTILPVTDEN